MLDIIDITKIAATVGGVVLLWTYKRRIACLLEGILTGEGSEISGKKEEELMDDIEKAFKEVLRWRSEPATGPV